MKTSIFIKVFAFCIVFSLLTLIFAGFRVTFYIKHSVPSNMKFILQWTSKDSIPFVYMGSGQECFLRRKCAYINCFVTSDKKLLESYTKFDVIAFAGPELSDMLLRGLISNHPKERSMHQKYVFASIESANNYEIKSNSYDGFFNWTWTYKLDSDLRWGYIVVRDSHNNVIGPQADMNWLKLEEMDQVPDDLKAKLRNKRKIAAWIVSNCYSTSRREVFFEALQEELQHVHNQSIDVYGDCGLHVCEEQETCDKKISDDYYFYLSFENSFSEDYVTEKLLLALKNNAVPIVYGGANYTRFMPDGIYLNALQLGAPNLAAKMVELMKDPAKYANYFRWKNHYRYERTIDNPDTDEYCEMCALLNDRGAVKKTTVYTDFQNWWNPKTP